MNGSFLLVALLLRNFCASENHNFYLHYDSLKYKFSEDRNAIFICLISIVANCSV